MNRTFKFRGIPSGDQECFCFAMPLADAMRNGFYDLAHNYFFPDLVSVSPDRMVAELDAGQMYEFEITIKATYPPLSPAEARERFGHLFENVEPDEPEPTPLYTPQYTLNTPTSNTAIQWTHDMADQPSSTWPHGVMLDSFGRAYQIGEAGQVVFIRYGDWLVATAPQPQIVDDGGDNGRFQESERDEV